MIREFLRIVRKKVVCEPFFRENRDERIVGIRVMKLSNLFGSIWKGSVLRCIDEESRGAQEHSDSFTARIDLSIFRVFERCSLLAFNNKYYLSWMVIIVRAGPESNLSTLWTFCFIFRSKSSEETF